MKILLACKLHHPPQPSTLRNLGQFACRMPPQLAASQPVASLSGSGFFARAVSSNTASA
jgi:ABC-type uncharacterized transport system YnjBCD substrate-binding protein